MTCRLCILLFDLIFNFQYKNVINLNDVDLETILGQIDISYSQKY